MHFSSQSTRNERLFEMATYTDEQISRYLRHIGYTKDAAKKHAAEDPLGLLTRLQILHMARVPFESLSLHYSKYRTLSLDPEDLFVKIVGKGRGGYCMEVNTFYAVVLRSLGFTLFSTGGRVRNEAGYKGWDHMVNIVTINGQRYLVDVGFGTNGATRPVPLQHGHEFFTISPAQGRLEYRSIDAHTDPNQRVWVYSVRQNKEAPWREMYSFAEFEFISGDFEVMNMHTSSTPQSFFVQSVMCMQTILDDEQQNPVGKMILHRDYVKRQIGDSSEILEKLESEPQRVEALKKYFDITLSGEEQRGIRGLASELKDRSKHA
ncbi:hypothetical protein B0T21DRAFT_357942 [Apiosordaria backusii]|uniref:Arylamine N-acetyltransferase n=1 Tax=Apiosordaria backusii TaxID=314023 RepID=A0AA40ES60_9PEZI|nr:hypothetical protein B0T21DRAFT_357942 [Apiosordaria backusii]